MTRPKLHLKNKEPLKPGSIADNMPPNPDGTKKATEDNDLTTGHSQPGDGGDANSKQRNPER